MADDDEQPTQVISGSAPRGGSATLEPHEPRLADGGNGGGQPPYPPTGYGGDDWDGGDGDGGDRRIAILAAIIGILVVIVLFLLLKPGSDDEATTSATPTPAATATAAPTATSEPEATATPEPEATATPDAGAGSDGGATIGDGSSDGNVPTLTADGTTKFTVSQGDNAVFKVRNDEQETQEVHVHGYDKSFDVEPGETRTISFQASITGIFEIEFEGSGTQIGELTVEP